MRLSSRSRSGVATEDLVMDFEVDHGSADLTAPAVSPKSGPLWICNFSHRLQVLQAGVCHPLRGENLIDRDCAEENPAGDLAAL
jgi:hypothetical protein